MADPNDCPDLVLYDGVCGLCNGAVQFILARDRGKRFAFAPIQSRPAAEILRRHGLAPAAVAGTGPDKGPDKGPDDGPQSEFGPLTTIYLIENFRGDAPLVSVRSRAVLRIACHLGWPWSWLSWLRVLPAFALDPFYRLVSWSRYRLFGKHEACVLPKPEWRDRFLWE